MYDDELKCGPYPTSEVSAAGLSDEQKGTLSASLADIAGIVSHGTKLLELDASRHEKFRELVAENFATKYPQITQFIAPNRMPEMYRLTHRTDEARLLIKKVLNSD